MRDPTAAYHRETSTAALGYRTNIDGNRTRKKLPSKHRGWKGVQGSGSELAEMPAAMIPRLNLRPFILLCALACSACSSKPSTVDVEGALAHRLDQPGCVRSAMFQHFPVTLSDSEIGAIRTGNAPAFDRLASVGLLAKSGATYSLTPAGQQAYRSDQEGFCYSAGFEIRKTLDISPIAGAGDSSVADKGWTVTLAIAQKPVADWARDPGVAAMAIDKTVLSTEPRTYHVILAHFRGEDGLRLDDPMFMLPRGFDVWEGF